MIKDLNQILIEWSYRTSDGKPDVKNSSKLILLEGVLSDFGWSREARAELLGTLMEATGDKIDPETKVKYKTKDKDGKDVDKETTYKSAISREKDSPAYIAAKALQKGDDTKDGEKLDEPSEFDRDVDSNKGVSPDFKRPTGGDGEEKPKDSEQKEKIDYWSDLDKLGKKEREIRKAQYLEQQLDYISIENSIPSGKGRFRLSTDDVNDYRKYLNDLSTPEKRERWMKKQTKENEKRIKEFGEISKEDVDDFIEVLRDKLGSKEFTRVRNSVMKKGDPPKDLVNDSRFRAVVTAYIQTGGISPISGKRVPFSETQLDHITSLGNGGKDEASNWMFMEERFNQYKGKKTDEDVRANLERDGYKTPSEYDVEVDSDKFKNSIIAENRAFWKTQFEKNGNDIHLTENMLNSMSQISINDLVHGYNEVNKDNQIARYPSRTEKVTLDNGEEVDLANNRDGWLNPMKGKPETWGLKKNYETGKIEKTDMDSYEDAYKKFRDGVRAGGGAIKSKPEFISDLKEAGLVLSKEDGENINSEIELIARKYETGQIKRQQNIRDAVKAAKEAPGSMSKKQATINKKMKEWDSENSEPESVAGMSKKAKEMNDEYLEWKEKRDIFRFNAWKQFDPYSKLNK